MDIPLEYYTESGRSVPSPAYAAGVDFDPSDPDEVEAVKLASEWDRYYSMQALERENADLRARIAELEGWE